MAKDQDLSLNTSKLSGLCGRLMCCLAYEYDNYAKIKAAERNTNDRHAYMDRLMASIKTQQKIKHFYRRNKNA